MKLGVLTKPYRQRPLEEALKIISDIGYDEITLGSLGMSNLPHDHCNASALIQDDAKLDTYMKMIADYGLKVSTIQCTANPVHPRKDVAAQMDKELRDCIVLASKMGIDNVSTFSGCPGDNENATFPNWVSYCWPFDHGEVLEWQWEKKLIPYWKDLAAFARDHGINKIGLEFHPNFNVYNPKTLRKLRDAVGPEIGACVDVSHLFWMGMDPATVIHELSDCVYQFHAKDTLLNQEEIKKNGVIELGSVTKESGQPAAWRFTIPGYGHGEGEWRHIINALREIGYDGALTLEHEDTMMGRDEGLIRNYEFLSRMVMRDPAEYCNWTQEVKKPRFWHLYE